MKSKIIIFALILLAYLPTIWAGSTINLDLFDIIKNGENIYTTVTEGDRLLFEYAGINRTILINEFKVNPKTNMTYIDINIYSFEDNITSPYYASLFPGSLTKLDINKDIKKDVQLEIMPILNQENKQKGYFLIDKEGKPSLIISISLSNESSLDLVKLVDKNNLNIKPLETKKSFFSSKLFIMLIIFLALIVTGYFILRKPKKETISK